MSSLRVIKPKAMKNDKGREGVHKIGKISRRRLWMAPNLQFCVTQFFSSPKIRVMRDPLHMILYSWH